jgi:hypothetical protein
VNPESLIELAEKAGLPWKTTGIRPQIQGSEELAARISGPDYLICGQWRVEDAEYAVAACNAVPELCQRVLAAEAVLKRIAGLEVVVESHADCANVAIHGINIARQALPPPHP